jgi:hypothetical protein
MNSQKKNPMCQDLHLKIKNNLKKTSNNKQRNDKKIAKVLLVSPKKK